nr:uncharacterized protein LOC100199298 isoform X3 [Hydra vulgaris]
MVKQHNIKLTIKNSTPFAMTFISNWFDSGRVADQFSWPKEILSNETQTILCYERDWAMSGCSGYVQYLMNGSLVTIGFSNPSVGTNKLGVSAGVDGKQFWEVIESKEYQEVNDNIKVGGKDVLITSKCTGGTTNDANILFVSNQKSNNQAFPPPYSNNIYPPPNC